MSRSLYDKYGGFSAVSRIVMDFYEQALESDQIGGYFENVNMPRLMDHQTKFISALLGGPASFGDEHLRRVHANLGISHADFDEMRALLGETLAEHGFAADDVEAAMGAIEAKRSIIVARDVA